MKVWRNPEQRESVWFHRQNRQSRHLSYVARCKLVLRGPSRYYEQCEEMRIHRQNKQASYSVQMEEGGTFLCRLDRS